MSTTTCKRCKSWQPGHTFSAESSCHRFVELPAEQMQARRDAATAAVRNLKESK